MTIECGVMLATGASPWWLIAFGAATIPLGRGTWHKIGSLGKFLKCPSLVHLAYITLAGLVALTALEFWAVRLHVE